MKYINIYVLAFLIFYVPSASSAVNKWKDADGKIHYGDRPGTVEAAAVKVDKPADGHQDNARRLRSETSRVLSDVARENAAGEANKRQLNMEHRMQSEKEKRDESNRHRSPSRSR